jgi:DeoR/GlpR family transcriptional regulator of sugar metabolism
MGKTNSDLRREQMVNLLEETGTLNVGELADRFGVSVVTIRKDLGELETEGLLERTFGGAVFSHRSRFNRSFLQRTTEHRQEKHAIAAAALEYVQNGDTIFLDAGTTTLALAQLLKRHVKSVFIITCSVPAALELSSAGYDILLLGGTIGRKGLALFGRETLRMIERYRADKAFLGSSGFTIEKGHSTPNPEDAQIKEALIRVADKTLILVDSSKYGHDCLTSFAHLRDVYLTITDNGLARHKAKALEAVGARLRIAEVIEKADPNRDSAGSTKASAVETPSRHGQLPLHRQGNADSAQNRDF